MTVQIESLTAEDLRKVVEEKRPGVLDRISKEVLEEMLDCANFGKMSSMFSSSFISPHLREPLTDLLEKRGFRVRAVGGFSGPGLEVSWSGEEVPPKPEVSPNRIIKESGVRVKPKSEVT